MNLLCNWLNNVQLISKCKCFFFVKTRQTAASTWIIFLHSHTICVFMFLRLLIFLYHIIVFTAPGIIGCIYQQIDVNSISMFITICVGGVTNGVEGVLEPFVQCIRYSAIFWMGFWYCSELDKAVKEVSYLEEELDWKVYFISVKNLLNELSRVKNSNISFQSNHHLCCQHEGNLDTCILLTAGNCLFKAW